MISSGFVAPTGTESPFRDARPQPGTFRRLSELGGLELRRDELPCEGPPIHTFDEFVIFTMASGFSRCVFGRGADTVGPGDVLVIAPGVPFTHAAAGGSPIAQWLLVPTSMMPGFPADQPRASVESGVVSDPLLSARLTSTIDTLLGPRLAWEGAADEVRRILIELLGRRSRVPAPVPPGAEPRRVRVVREYLAAHLASPASLDQLSDLVGVSPFYLQRTFKAVTRMSPREYVMDLRIRRARQLLREGLAPRVVGASVGFFDQSHFTRAFRKLTGVTPGVYADGGTRYRPAAGAA